MESSDIKSLQIHAFLDSSERAYAAKHYVQVETQTEICSQLVSAKTRVAITLPRLELLSGLLLVNLVTKEDKNSIPQCIGQSHITTAFSNMAPFPSRTGVRQTCADVKIYQTL